MMGWTETYINGTIKEYFMRQYNNTPLAVSVVDRNKVYAAIPYNDSIYAAVWIFRYQPNSHYNFCYKDMDESCGPYQTNCPIHILNLLTPIDSEYAMEWRANCHNTLFYRRKKMFNTVEQQFKYVTRGVENIEEKVYLEPVLRRYLESKGFDKEAIFKKFVEVWGARIL